MVSSGDLYKDLVILLVVSSDYLNENYVETKGPDRRAYREALVEVLNHQDPNHDDEFVRLLKKLIDNRSPRNAEKMISHTARTLLDAMVSGQDIEENPYTVRIAQELKTIILGDDVPEFVLFGEVAHQLKPLSLKVLYEDWKRRGLFAPDDPDVGEAAPIGTVTFDSSPGPRKTVRTLRKIIDLGC